MIGSTFKPDTSVHDKGTVVTVYAHGGSDSHPPEAMNNFDCLHFYNLFTLLLPTTISTLHHLHSHCNSNRTLPIATSQYHCGGNLSQNFKGKRGLCLMRNSLYCNYFAPVFAFVFASADPRFVSIASHIPSWLQRAHILKLGSRGRSHDLLLEGMTEEWNGGYA